MKPQIYWHSRWQQRRFNVIKQLCRGKCGLKMKLLLEMMRIKTTTNQLWCVTLSQSVCQIKNRFFLWSCWPHFSAFALSLVSFEEGGEAALTPFSSSESAAQTICFSLTSIVGVVAAARVPAPLHRRLCTAISGVGTLHRQGSRSR